MIALCPGKPAGAIAVRAIEVTVDEFSIQGR